MGKLYRRFRASHIIHLPSIIQRVSARSFVPPASSSRAPPFRRFTPLSRLFSSSFFFFFVVGAFLLYGVRRSKLFRHLLLWLSRGVTRIDTITPQKYNAYIVSASYGGKWQPQGNKLMEKVCCVEDKLSHLRIVGKTFCNVLLTYILDFKISPPSLALSFFRAVNIWIRHIAKYTLIHFERGHLYSS